MKFDDWNDALAAICKRVQELADSKLPELRMLHPDNVSEGTKTVPTYLKDQTRGECIVAILLEEFTNDENNVIEIENS